MFLMFIASTPQAPHVVAPPLSEAAPNNTNSTGASTVPPPDAASADTAQSSEPKADGAPVSPIAQLDALLGANYAGGADDAANVQQIESYNARRQQDRTAYLDFLNKHPELFDRNHGFSDVGRVFYERLDSLYDYEAKRLRLPIKDALFLAYGFALSWHLAKGR